MGNSEAYEQVYSTYIEKQKKFKDLVKSVQYHINLKEYKKQGYSFDEFVKVKWNISKAQAYRYLISAKVLDQLEEFDIQPSYERLCRSLHSYAKTTQQIKLLWKTILSKVGTSPDNISSLFVSKIWKELYNDSRYSHICRYEEILIDNIEKTLNKYSNNMKHKQINLKPASNINTNYNYNNNFNTNNNITSINSNNSFNQIKDNSSIYDSTSNNNNTNTNMNYNNLNCNIGYCNYEQKNNEKGIINYYPNNTYKNITYNEGQNINKGSPLMKNSKCSIIYITDINNINNNNNNNEYIINQQNNYQNYSTVSNISSPISSESPNQSLKNNQYIIYNNPIINNSGNTQKNNLLSPVDNSISFTYNNNINNVNLQNNIPVTTTATTYIDTTSQYLPSPKADQIQKPVSFVQSYVTVSNIPQNNVIYYYK